MFVFSTYFQEHFIAFQKKLVRGESSEENSAHGAEIHALSSATKPLCAWTGRDAIQDCRESCGGHGYLKGKINKVYMAKLNINKFYTFKHAPSVCFCEKK